MQSVTDIYLLLSLSVSGKDVLTYFIRSLKNYLNDPGQRQYKYVLSSIKQYINTSRNFTSIV